MTFFQIYLIALGVILTRMSLLWIISIQIKIVSIADLFRGIGFILFNVVYCLQVPEINPRKILLLILVTLKLVIRAIMPELNSILSGDG